MPSLFSGKENPDSSRRLPLGTFSTRWFRSEQSEMLSMTPSKRSIGGSKPIILLQDNEQKTCQ